LVFLIYSNPFGCDCFDYLGIVLTLQRVYNIYVLMAVSFLTYMVNLLNFVVFGYSLLTMPAKALNW